MHRTCRAAIRIAACGIVPGCSRARCEPNLESVEEHAIGIIWIHDHSFVVPVLGIVACAGLAISECAALRTLHESPARAAVSRRPGADLAARGIAAAVVIVTDNGLHLGIDVVGVAWRDGNVYSAQLSAGGNVNKR